MAATQHRTDGDRAVIHHVVLFRLKPEVTTAEVDELAAGLRALAGLADGVVSYSCGPDLGLAEGNDHFAIVAVFESPVALAGYLARPEHATLVARMVPAMVAEKHSVQLAD